MILENPVVKGTKKINKSNRIKWISKKNILRHFHICQSG